MKLTRPLVFFDVETTGTDPSKDRIVTFSALKTYPNGKTHYYDARFNPQIEMSLEVIAIHGIDNYLASTYPLFHAQAQPILNYFDGCDLAGFNCLNFDVPILWEELNRTGRKWDLTGVNIIDVGNIFKIKERRTLEAAVKFYCGKEHTGAHGSKADAAATSDVLEGQISWYADLQPLSVSDLAKFSKMDDRFDLAGKIVKDKDGDPTYSFGKSKGVKVRDDLSYAYWMMKSDFSQQTKSVLRQIVDDIEAFS